MTEQVKIPTPVYDEAKERANQQDITIGAVIKMWMHKADVLDEVGGAIGPIKNDGDGGGE